MKGNEVFKSCRHLPIKRDCWQTINREQYAKSLDSRFGLVTPIKPIYRIIKATAKNWKSLDQVVLTLEKYGIFCATVPNRPWIRHSWMDAYSVEQTLLLEAFRRRFCLASAFHTLLIFYLRFLIWVKQAWIFPGQGSQDLGMFKWLGDWSSFNFGFWYCASQRSLRYDLWASCATRWK